MIIRHEQFETLHKSGCRSFEDRVYSALSQSWPSKVSESGEQQIRENIRSSLARARKYGMDSEQLASMYINCTYLLGPGFDRDPQHVWAQTILSAPALDPEIRAAQLVERAMEHDPLEPILNGSSAGQDVVAFRAFHHKAKSFSSLPVGATTVPCPPMNGRQSDEKIRVTVRIEEAPRVVLACTCSPSSRHGAALTLHAVNATPPGGEFRWRLKQPGAILLNGPVDAAAVTVEEKRRGVADLEVEYSYNGEAVTDQVRVQVIEPLIEVGPQPRMFEGASVGEASDPQVVTVHNTGDAPLRIQRYELNPDNGNFVIENAAALRKRVEPDGPPVKLRLAYTPKSVGEHGTYLNIASNACNRPLVSIPLRGKARTRTWIEIHLIDPDGKPVPSQRFRLRLPDRSIREGVLNNDGLARFEDLESGSCDVMFPDLDGSWWSPVVDTQA